MVRGRASIDRRTVSTARRLRTHRSSVSLTRPGAAVKGHQSRRGIRHAATCRGVPVRRHQVTLGDSSTSRSLACPDRHSEEPPSWRLGPNRLRGNSTTTWSSAPTAGAPSCPRPAGRHGPRPGCGPTGAASGSSLTATAARPRSKPYIATRPPSRSSRRPASVRPGFDGERAGLQPRARMRIDHRRCVRVPQVDPLPGRSIPPLGGDDEDHRRSASRSVYEPGSARFRFKLKVLEPSCHRSSPFIRSRPMSSAL